MQAMAISTTPAVWTVRAGKQGLPDPVPRPPGRPPGEPIIIKVPPRLPEAPDIDRSDDEDEEEAEIRTPPEIVPELPPPPRPEERAVRPTQRIRSTAITAGALSTRRAPDGLAAHVGTRAAQRRQEFLDASVTQAGRSNMTLRRDAPSSF